MKSDTVSNEEKLWLLALVRGPLGPTSVKRVMSDQVRDSLLGKGLIRWKTDFYEITPKGIALVEGTAAAGASRQPRMVA